MIGGSITAGARASSRERNYGGVLAQWWRQTFPKAKIELVNAGIGATGSNYGALRAERDLLARRPDFVVIEYGVNDPNTQASAETLEGLVRQVLKQPNQPAVVLLFMMNRSGGNAQEWHGKVGQHYRLPMLSFRDALWPEIQAGRLKWEEVEADMVHPNDRGHAYAARFITDLLAKLLKDLPSDDKLPSIKPLPRPLLGDLFKQVALLEADTLQPVKNDGWAFDAKARCWKSDRPGSRIEFETAGRVILIMDWHIRGPMGKAKVQVDDRPALVRDAWYDQTWGGYRQTSELARDLAPGKHRVAFEILAERNPQSTGHEYRILGLGAAGVGTEADSLRRGYTIPLVDLADQTERQIVVDREPGQYLGHPTTVLLEDGKTMIAVYPKGHGRGAIVMKRSTDGGRTWSQRLPTPASWATSKEVPTIHRVVDAKGTKRLILFSGLYPIRMAVSQDDGQSWSELKPIGDFGGIVTMGSVVSLHTGPGHYMALFHDDGRFIGPAPAKAPKGFLVYKTLSVDGGLTWGLPEVIATHPRAHLCEPGTIRSPDGKQIAVLLRENSRRLNSFVIFSDDEGKTWSKPRELPGALTGDRHTGHYSPDGRLFITFRDTTLESPTKGDWVGWVGTYDDIVQGREGQYRVRLMKNHKGADCAYPGLELLPDGTLVTTTYGHWTKAEPPYIVSVRFTMKEIDVQAKK